MTKKRIYSFIRATWPHKEAMLLLRSTALVLLMIGLHFIVEALQSTGWDLWLIDLIEKTGRVWIFGRFVINEILGG